jgi:hypothetical protein
MMRLPCIEQLRNSYKLLVGKPEGKRQVLRPRSRWKNNINDDLKEM